MDQVGWVIAAVGAEGAAYTVIVLVEFPAHPLAVGVIV
jgi:hypothetical protein